VNLPWSWLHADHPRRQPDIDFQHASVAVFDLSGTGYEDVVFRAIASCLEDRIASGDGIRWAVPRGFAVEAELAAAAGFLDYGVSLRTAWITNEGRAWLADYHAWEKLT
jgi:hypothetical protein